MLRNAPGPELGQECRLPSQVPPDVVVVDAVAPDPELMARPAVSLPALGSLHRPMR